MGKIKAKLIDWKNRLKDRHMLSIIVVLFSIIVILGIYTYKKQTEYRQASENAYNLAFFEVVDYVKNVEVFMEVKENGSKNKIKKNGTEEGSFL